MLAPILASYHPFRRVDVTELAGQSPADFFADSGAFSAHNSGAVVRVNDYTAWLRDHRTVINFAAALDVIGDPATSRRNADTQRAAVGDDVTIVPTFHVGSPWTELRSLCRDYRFVCLGGAVGVNDRVAALTRWLASAHRILTEHGVVAHGLGLTRPPYPQAFNWYSVDSSYWSSASRTGSISLWHRGRFTKFRVGTRAAAKPSAADAIRRYGADPVVVARPGYGIVREVGDRGRADRQWMNRASAESYWRYAAAIAAGRPPIPAPPGVDGDGPKLYLAAGDPRSWRQLTQWWSDIDYARRRPA